MYEKLTERDFEKSAEHSMGRFAARIRASGLTVYKIASLCGLSWRTVKNASDGLPIRFDSAERIKLALRRYGKGGADDGIQ